MNCMRCGGQFIDSLIYCSECSGRRSAFNLFIPAYEGEGGEGGDDDGNKGGDGDDGNKGGDGDTFTAEQQKAVDQIVAKRRERDRAHIKKLTDQLSELEQGSQLSDEEKKKLQTQIKDLKKQFQTKEELAAEELEAAKNENAEKLATQTQRGDYYQGLFEHSTIQTALTQAAVAENAVLPSQVVELLTGKTRLVEKKDEDGKITGYVPQVTFIGIVEKDGERQQAELDLPAAEAVKKMRAAPELYGNLFKDSKTGGTGSVNVHDSDGGDTSGPVKSMTDWEKRRKELGLPE